MERAALTLRIAARAGNTFRLHPVSGAHHFGFLKLLPVFMCLIYSAGFGQSRVQVVNLATAPASANLVDIYLESDLLMNDVPRGFSTAFLDLLPGQVYHLSIAPHTSTSVTDTVYSMSFFMIQEQQFIVAFYGEVGNANAPPSHFLEMNAKRLAADANKADVSFVHVATGEGPIDMVKREGGMVFGNLAYEATTGYLPFDTTEHYLDVKYSGTSNIIATYRLSLEAYKGQALKVFALGDASLPYTFSLFAVYSDGFTTPVDYAPLARVQFFNTLADTVDVYKNGTRFSDNAPYGGAMEYKNIPANFDFNIAVSPWTSMNANNAWSTFTYTFQNTQTYAAVTAGIINDSEFPLTMFFTDGRRENAPAGEVALTFFNGLYGFDDLDIQLQGAGTDTLFETVKYGDFTAYSFTDSAAFLVNLSIRKANTQEVVYALPLALEGDAGEALTFALAHTPDGQGTALWKIKSDGSSEVIETVNAHDVLTSSSFTLYPNPVTQGQMAIKLAKGLDRKATWRLYDSTMRLVSEGIIPAGVDTRVLSLPFTESGIYFFEMVNSDFNIFKKIIIQNP